MALPKMINFGLYRSRQYHESKVLHNTEVTWFSMFRHSHKTDYFDQNCKESHMTIYNTSFGIFKPQIGRLYSSQSMLKISLKIVILVNFEAKWSNFPCLRKELIFAVKTWPIHRAFKIYKKVFESLLFCGHKYIL